MEVSYVFLYDQPPNNDIDFQKVHITFGCVLLTRSDICHGGYGGSKGNLMLSGTFHNNGYDYRENGMGDCNYLVDPNDWQTYISEHLLFKANKISQLLL